MKQEEQKSGEAKKFMNKVQERIKEAFMEYKKDVEAKNYEQNGGTLHKH
jgi:ketopantoate hydroxymethyltransferase